MGMSASQARFLSLTARKTNVEYEGQQINQQRTTLSNESANYYSQLTNLTVPTPPSSQDYTKTSYTFTDGAETNTINSLIAQKNGYYILNYTQSTLEDSVVSNGNVIVSKKSNNGANEYYVGSTPLRVLGSNDNVFCNNFESLIVDKYGSFSIDAVSFEPNTLNGVEPT